MNSFVLTVSQLNRYVKMSLEGDGNLSRLFLGGEISNCKKNSFSGHIYFSLKDDTALIKCVMFSSDAARLKFIPQDGMKVICRGRVSLYERDGSYQFYAADMQPDGIGAMAIAFEQTKKRLEAEGLFSQERKRPIPRYPKRVAVVTSDTGAAVRDIINIISRRWPVCEIVLCPTSVQGEKAAAEMVQVLNRLYTIILGGAEVDTIIIGRGGGSAEDISAFNDEFLARTIALSPVPIVSAVGHETDFSISDFVADLRAPTPSAAAELCVPDIDSISLHLLRLKHSLSESELVLIERLETRLKRAKESRVFANPALITDMAGERLSKATDRMANAFKETVSQNEKGLLSLIAKLEALSPLSVMSRGFAVVESGGNMIKTAAEVAEGDNLCVKMQGGEVNCTAKNVTLYSEEGKNG